MKFKKIAMFSVMCFLVLGIFGCEMPGQNKGDTGPIGPDSGGTNTGGGGTYYPPTGGGGTPYYPPPTTGGGYQPPPTGGGNGFPYVNINPPKNPVFFNERVALTANGGDPDGDPITYEWKAMEGVFDNPHGSTVNWMAPNMQRMVNIEVIVRDGRGGESRSSVMINVIPQGGGTMPNSPPMFNGEPYVVYPGGNFYAKSGDKVTLYSSAYDPNGDSIMYNWSCTLGFNNFTTSGSPSTEFTIPPDPYATGYELVCKVTDSKGMFSERRIWINVQPTGNTTTYNNPPVITDVHSDMNVIGPGGKVRLFANAYDPDAGDIVKYHWHSQSGTGMLSNPGPDAQNCDWTAPAGYVGVGMYELICDVTDMKGAMTQRSVWINVYSY